MNQPRTLEPASIGVRIAGCGSALPQTRLTNADLEKLMDTSDEWIVQRTGIQERRIARREQGESTLTLSKGALNVALERAGMKGEELDLVICATMTAEMGCPPTSCRLADEVGAVHAGAWDLSGACCGFVYGLNVAHSMMRASGYRNVALIGADTLTRYMKYDTSCRDTAILFGDAAGAVVLKATDDLSKGMIAQAIHADGGRWKDLYVPEHICDFPEEHEADPELLQTVRMNGRAVFRFAVGTFQDLIAETLEKAGVTADDVAHYVCHQSNARILSAARERFGIPEEKMYVNIERYGNTVAASVPLCLDELWTQGRVREGDLVLFVAFGGGLTWGSSLWRV